MGGQLLRSAKMRALKSKTRVPKHTFSKDSIAFIALLVLDSVLGC